MTCGDWSYRLLRRGNQVTKVSLPVILPVEVYEALGRVIDYTWQEEEWSRESGKESAFSGRFVSDMIVISEWRSCIPGTWLSGSLSLFLCVGAALALWSVILAVLIELGFFVQWTVASYVANL